MKKKYVSPKTICIYLGISDILAGSLSKTLNDDFNPTEVDEEQKDGDIIFGL